MSTFDGHGWPDLAYQRRDGVDETQGFAWCLYAGALLNQPNIQVDQLLAQQSDVGGFHTHLRADENKLAEPNVKQQAWRCLRCGYWSMTHRVKRKLAFLPTVDPILIEKSFKSRTIVESAFSNAGRAH